MRSRKHSHLLRHRMNGFGTGGRGIQGAVPGDDAMASIEKFVDVNVPLRTAYNQWTQFEDFPRFMEGVESVEQIDDRRLRWKAKLGGRDVTWTAEIVDQVPDQWISWRSTSGAKNAGTVRFEKRGANETRILLS